MRIITAFQNQERRFNFLTKQKSIPMKIDWSTLGYVIVGGLLAMAIYDLVFDDLVDKVAEKLPF